MVGILVLAVTIYTPVFVQGVLGRSATASGTVLIPLSLAWVASSFVSGQLVSRTGRYRVFPLIGGCLVLAGTILLTRAGEGASSISIAGTLCLTGAGMGMTWPVYMVATQNAVARSELGAASGALLFFRTLAGSVGVAVLGTVLNAPERRGGASGRGRGAAGVDRSPRAGCLARNGVPAAGAGRVALLVVAFMLEEHPLRSASDKDNLTQLAILDTVTR